jgi:hypothetical protein
VQCKGVGKGFGLLKKPINRLTFDGWRAMDLESWSSGQEPERTSELPYESESLRSLELGRRRNEEVTLRTTLINIPLINHDLDQGRPML